ncbi:MAG: hypothetical protein ACI9A7_000724 [Cyclobacteriaceae bacterium]|jgi:hypothetical protein
MMTFDEYLKSKKIDPKTFAKKDQRRFSEFERIFNQVHPNSFTQQKIFLINRIRREYPLKEELSDDAAKKTKQAKPKIAPRIKK